MKTVSLSHFLTTLFLTTLFLTTLFFTSCSQINSPKSDITNINNKISVNLESGVGENIAMVFSVMHIDSIENSIMYKNSGFSRIDSFLLSKIDIASFMTKLQLKNGVSYTPIAGDCRVSFDKDYGIIIIFPFKAQNGYGNFIISESFYNINWDKTKNEEVTDIRLY